MALQQSFTISQSQDAGTLYVTDSTGVYNVSTNPGGYNAPNTLRTDLALILIAKYKSIAEDVELTPATVDPETVDNWSITGIDNDGHYEFNIYSVVKKTGAETPATNDFVYDFTANQLQRWNGSAWVSATNSELESNDEPRTVTDYPVLGKMWIAFNNINKLRVVGSKLISRTDLNAAISDTSAMLNGTIALFAEGSYSVAQDNIEKYQSRVDQLTALTQ